MINIWDRSNGLIVFEDHLSLTKIIYVICYSLANYYMVEAYQNYHIDRGNILLN